MPGPGESTPSEEITQGSRGRATKDFLDEARRTAGYSLFDLLHGYVYGRWPYQYIATGVGENLLSRLLAPIARFVSWLAPDGGTDGRERGTVADTYHGKVMPTAAARRLVTLDAPIDLRDLEQVIPFERARAVILRQPDHIVALQCPCRSARSDPCLPLDVCLIVGEPFASFVHTHHPERSRRVSQTEAEHILRSERDRGHVHHAFFKDAMLDRFYAICNCCECCCGAMQAMRNGSPMLISSGYVSQVDETRCMCCGLCVDECPFGALRLAEIRVEVSEALCMGCGICAHQCPEGALFLARDESKPEPLVVHGA
jgi:ferredoxin